MPVPDIVEHVGHVLEQEGIGFERGALQLLGRAAAGSMRDALSLTDQAIAYSAGQISEATVRNMLGALDQTYLLRVLDALADADGATLMTVVDEIAARSLSFGNALQELGAMLHRIATIQLIPATASDETVDADEVHLRVLAGRLAADDVQLYYQIAAHGRRDLSLAPDEITGFSMTLLRMLAFRIDDSAGTSQAAAPKPLRTPAPSALARGSNVAIEAPVARRPVDPLPIPVPATPAPRIEPVTPVAAPPSTSATSDATTPLAIDDWVAVVGRLKLTGLALQLVQKAELVAHDHRSITLRVDIKSLASAAALDKLKLALAQHFGRPVAVSIEVGAVKGATVAAALSDERAARQADAQAIIDADPFVQAVVRDFGGARIVPGSVKPV